MIALANVTKRYGSARALADITLTLETGVVTAILGPNGAGKSTLLGVLSTTIRPTSGKVTLPSRGEIGFVGHEPGVYLDLNAFENLDLFARLFGVPGRASRVSELVARVGLDESAAARPARTYSRGMLQRLALARALLHEPPFLLFDEPASALDPTGARWLADVLATERAAGRTVVLVTHDLEAAGRSAQRLVVLRRGRVVGDERAAEGFAGESVARLYARSLGEA